MAKRSYAFVSVSNPKRTVYLACTVITTMSEQKLSLDLIACVQIYQDCVQIHFRWPVECISNVSPVTNDEILFPCSHVILSVGTLAAAKQKKNHQRRGLLWLSAISNRILHEMFSELTGMDKSTVLELFHAICTLYYTAEYAVF